MNAHSDGLTELLAISGVRGVLGAHIEAGSDWGWWSAASAGAAFHAVTSGTAWLAVEGGEPLQLLPGDVLLLPRGTAHTLGSDPAAVAPKRRDAIEHGERGVVRIGSGPTRTHILCAHYVYDTAASTQVLPALPDIVHIPTERGGGMDDTIRLVARELTEPRLATSVVLDHLVEILLVQLLRAWLDAHELPGQLGALRDPIVGAAMSLIHGDPARAWTADTLAREVNVSRATLARRFVERTGETPAGYLTRWRMDLAAKRLRETGDALEAIAQAVGYTSVFAFSRAFRRTRGEPPGRYRARPRHERAVG